MGNKTEQALSVALYKMLRPMVRLLLRHGITYRHFADVARHVYVDVARDEFGLPGRKTSYSRVAVLTGINRKDIAKLEERPHPLADNPENSGRRPPVARAIDGWINDFRFRDERGELRALAVDSSAGPEADFAILVRDYCSDVPHKALLDEMLRLGSVTFDGTTVRLATSGYIPYADMEESFRIVGTAASDLLTTMDYNLAGAGSRPFIQRTVSYSDIPVELLEDVRRRCNREGATFLLQINDWLSKCDSASQNSDAKPSKARAGVGIYYFEYPNVDDQQ